MRRPPRSRRAGCFVGVHAVARAETKHKDNRTGVKSLWKPGCTAKWCALADAGRTRAAEGKLVANFSLPKSDGPISGFAKNGDSPTETGEKWIRPMKLNGAGFELGEPKFENGKPLYVLHRIASNPDAAVWVVEG